ncbi:hypothetical protein, partial [Streptomyces kronopolitis]
MFSAAARWFIAVAFPLRGLFPRCFLRRRSGLSPLRLRRAGPLRLTVSPALSSAAPQWLLAVAPAAGGWGSGAVTVLRGWVFGLLRFTSEH